MFESADCPKFKDSGSLLLSLWTEAPDPVLVRLPVAILFGACAMQHWIPGFACGRVHYTYALLWHKECLQNFEPGTWWDITWKIQGPMGAYVYFKKWFGKTWIGFMCEFWVSNGSEVSIRICGIWYVTSCTLADVDIYIEPDFSVFWLYGIFYLTLRHILEGRNLDSSGWW
jgi:hypothetical protein